MDVSPKYIQPQSHMNKEGDTVSQTSFPESVWYFVWLYGVTLPVCVTSG